MATSYIIGGIVGLIYGSIIGYLKYALLWKKILKTNMEISMGAVYMRMGISYVVNIVTLLFIFLLRNQMPWSFAIVLLTAAIALSITGKLAPISNIVTKVTDESLTGVSSNDKEDNIEG